MSPPALRKVLMTADTIGGVWTFAADLSAGLGAHGVEVTLFAMGGAPSDAQRAEIAALPNVRLVATGHRLEWMRDSEADVVESGRALLHLAREVQPDVVHANGYYHATLPFDSPVLLTAHSCVPSWWRACRGGALPDEWRQYRRWVSAAIRNADMLVAPTQAFLHEFQMLHGDGNNARTIRNGRDARLFCPKAKKTAVIAGGRLWDDAKNVSVLCSAAAQLDIPVRLAGDVTSPDGSAPHLPNVEMLGRLTPAQMAAELGSAAIFASPAIYEPFGLTVLEAALSGCALALSDIPTFRELWDGAAQFVDARDVEGWRATLGGLAAGPLRAAAQGRKARARAEGYSIAKTTEGYLQAYRDVLARPPLIREAAA